MIRPALSLPLIALLAAQPVFAQDNTTSTETPAETGESTEATQETGEAQAETPAPEATSTETPAPEDTSTEAPADATTEEEAPANDPADNLYTETHGDWTTVCEKVLTGDDPCGSMQQVLKGAEGNDVIQIELNRLTGANTPAAVMLINTPLLTLLPEGVGLSIDGGKTARVPFFVCDNSKCIARVSLRNEDVSAFKRGNAATMTIVPANAPDQKITTEMSLSGFTAAYDSLKEFGQN